MKRLINLRLAMLIMAAFSFTIVAEAQSGGSSLEEDLAEIFENLDKTKIQSGYLRDQAAEYVDFDLFDGTALADSNYVGIGVFENFIRSINSANVSSPSITYDADDIVSDLTGNTTGPVYLGAALFKYDYIVSNALTSGLLTYYGGKVYDVTINGIWQNPYAQKYACLFTVGTPVIVGSSVQYSFDPSDHVLGNVSPSLIEIDFGNSGNTNYINVTSGYSGTIIYPGYGVKELKMRITLLDNTVLQCHTYILLTQQPAAPSNVSISPDSTSIHEGYYYGESVSATISYKYDSSHNGCLIKPLIYVEGFDCPELSKDLNLLNNDHGDQHFDGFMNDWNNIPLSLQSSLDYDIIYVDWGNPKADIRANAKLLESILSGINSVKHVNGSSEKNIVVGHSMGGLITRYALADMEQSYPSRTHEVSHYISFDAPHHGVNVPVGAQYVLRDLYDVINGDGGYGKLHIGTIFRVLLTKYKNVLESTAARQMMFRYIDSSDTEDNNDHNNWISALDAIGFPKGDKGYPIENLAISNGNGLSLDSILCDFHLSASNATPNLMLFVNSLGLVGHVTIDAQMGRCDSNSSTKIADTRVEYSKRFAWMPSNLIYSTVLLDRKHYNTGTNPPYDILPGSFLKYYPRSTILDIIGAISENLSLSDSSSFAFVPVSSSLAVNNNNVSWNCYNNPPTPLVDTPFASLFTWRAAQIHNQYFHYPFEWCYNQMNMSITGPGSFIQTGDVFGVANSPSTFGTWSSSNSLIASINATGQVSVLSPGIVTITYEAEKEYDITDNITLNEKHHKHIRVLTGIPNDFILSVNNMSSNQYSFTAQSNNEEINSFLDDAVAGGRATYMWGIKSGTANIVWTPSTSRTLALNTQARTTVYFKIIDDQQREHGLRSQTIFPTLPPMNYDPRLIYTFMGDTYLYYSTIPDDGTLNNYFMIWAPPLAPFAQTPDKIIINNQVIQCYTTRTEMINGVSTTVYCFKILDSTHVQSIISNIDNYPGNTAIVSGSLYGGSTWLQDFTITVTKGIPIL